MVPRLALLWAAARYAALGALFPCCVLLLVVPCFRVVLSGWVVHVVVCCVLFFCVPVYCAVPCPAVQCCTALLRIVPPGCCVLCCFTPLV